VETMIAAFIFLGAYLAIATERVDRTVAALAGAVLMIVAGVLQQDEAFAAIDLNVIFLLLGMMVIANVMARTGVFQWVAIRAIRLARGDPWRILVVLCLLTGVASALLNNVTVVILVGPITLYAAAAAGVSPVPYLIAEILASNVGGTATLIGDPPNILIASAADIDFTTFALNMVPVTVVIFVALLVLLRVVFARDLALQRSALLTLDLDESGVITEPRLMRLSVSIMLLTVLGFLVAEPLGHEPATVALLGATVLFLATREDPTEVLAQVEWTTLFFFVGLFVLVEGLIKVGLIEALAAALLSITGGDPLLTNLGLIWAGGILSGIVDNIPYTAAMIPVVQQLGAGGMDVGPLWWSLALSADLGGNATIIGASANIVIASLAARAGQPISFRRFLPYGVATVVLSLAISSLYVWLRYLL
jgi:Na+/H+ antiporter NhaD/arsenite permease-like protein